LAFVQCRELDSHRLLVHLVPLLARVAAQVPFTLHVDRHFQALAKLFRDTGNSRASFLTADNSFSVPSSERDRFKRALLRFVLPESRLPTVAHDPTGRWPDEQGFW
jgi:hypothetical protein